MIIIDDNRYSLFDYSRIMCLSINRLTTANESKVNKLIAGDAKYQILGA